MFQRTRLKRFISFWIAASILGFQGSYGSGEVGINATKVAGDINALMNIRIDATPFRQAITDLLAINTSLCFIPSDAIMFTYTNHHLFDLVVLQRTAMEIGQVRKCLESRFITLCLDKKCMELCNTHAIPNCVRIYLPSIPHADFAGKSYGYFTWIKHELMYEATKAANQIFFFDADVAILRNPWLEVSYGRDELTGQKIPGPYDIQYQRERGVKEKGCGGSVNSGQMYIRNSSAIQSYFHKLFEKKYEAVITRIRLDQDFVSDIVNMLKYCTLPTKYFFGHCLFSREDSALLSEAIAYHTNCATGLGTKRALLHSFIEKVKNKRSKYVGGVL